MIELYKKARELHKYWIYEQDLQSQKFSKVKELQLRAADYSQIDVDGGSSPHIRHIKDCMKIIDEIEARRNGTSGYKALNMNEKYKIAIIYMKMLEDPSKFGNLERQIPAKE